MSVLTWILYARIQQATDWIDTRSDVHGYKLGLFSKYNA